MGATDPESEALRRVAVAMSPTQLDYLDRAAEALRQAGVDGLAEFVGVAARSVRESRAALADCGLWPTPLSVRVGASVPLRGWSERSKGARRGR
jgi:hypothetical protein